MTKTDLTLTASELTILQLSRNPEGGHQMERASEVVESLFQRKLVSRIWLTSNRYRLLISPLGEMALAAAGAPKTYESNFLKKHA